MNQTSPMNTATAAGAAAVVTPLVEYAAAICHLTPPAPVISSVVVLLVAGAHYVGLLVSARMNSQPSTNLQGATQ